MPLESLSVVRFDRDLGKHGTLNHYLTPIACEQCDPPTLFEPYIRPSTSKTIVSVKYLTALYSFEYVSSMSLRAVFEYGYMHSI